MPYAVTYITRNEVRTEQVFLLPVAEKRAQQAIDAGTADSVQIRDENGRLVARYPRERRYPKQIKR